MPSRNEVQGRKRKRKVLPEEAEATPPPPSSLEASTSDSSILRSLEQNLMCNICMETIACASTVVPCGHTFCYVCLETHARISNTELRQAKCPCCQESASTTLLARSVPNFVVDNIAKDFVIGSATVSTEEEKVKAFELRCEQGRAKRREIEERQREPSSQQPSENNRDSNDDYLPPPFQFQWTFHTLPSSPATRTQEPRRMAAPESLLLHQIFNRLQARHAPVRTHPNPPPTTGQPNPQRAPQLFVDGSNIVFVDLT